LKKYIIIAIAIIAFVGLNILIFTTIINKNQSLQNSIEEIASGENAKAYPYEDGVIAVVGTNVKSYDALGQIQYEYEAPRENMQAYRNDDVTILWHTNIAVLLDKTGEVLCIVEMPNKGNIFLGTCNAEQFAVAVIEEEQSKVRVYDFNKIEIWTNLFPDMSILSIGYFGESYEQLWSLALDYHGTIPITRLYTNYPGSSQTGRITVNDQICYAVEPLSNSIYIVGTSQVQQRTYTDTKLSEILINGWALQSSLVNDKQEASFLFAPVDTTGNNVPLSSLWYISHTGEQYRISMPANIISATLTERKIYAISNDGIYYMNFNGQGRSFAKFPFNIDEVVGVCKGKSAVLRSSTNYYIVSLNK
jgi:hypothetical protein